MVEEVFRQILQAASRESEICSAAAAAAAAAAASKESEKKNVCVCA
jgi:hypothetical protein